jgi:hypothetical protein
MAFFMRLMYNQANLNGHLKQQVSNFMMPWDYYQSSPAVDNGQFISDVVMALFML